MAEIDTEIRGVKVTVFGSNYTEDASVGINFGPDEVWAETVDGDDFELTENEIDDFSEKLANIESERLAAFEEDQALYESQN